MTGHHASACATCHRRPHGRTQGADTVTTSVHHHAGDEAAELAAEVLEAGTSVGSVAMTLHPAGFVRKTVFAGVVGAAGVAEEEADAATAATATAVGAAASATSAGSLHSTGALHSAGSTPVPDCLPPNGFDPPAAAFLMPPAATSHGLLLPDYLPDYPPSHLPNYLPADSLEPAVASHEGGLAHGGRGLVASEGDGLAHGGAQPSSSSVVSSGGEVDDGGWSELCLGQDREAKEPSSGDGVTQPPNQTASQHATQSVREPATGGALLVETAREKASGLIETFRDAIQRSDAESHDADATLLLATHPLSKPISAGSAHEPVTQQSSSWPATPTTSSRNFVAID